MKDKYVYVCATDFHHELEECEIKVYPTLERIKVKRSCVEQCGIIKLKITSCGFTQEPNFKALENR